MNVEERKATKQQQRNEIRFIPFFFSVVFRIFFYYHPAEFRSLTIADRKWLNVADARGTPRIESVKRITTGEKKKSPHCESELCLKSVKYFLKIVIVTVSRCET